MRFFVSVVGLLALAPALEAQTQTPDRLRRLLEGIRGATPVQCEMALGSINGWYGWRQIVPDRDPQAGPLVTWVPPVCSRSRSAMRSAAKWWAATTPRRRR